MRRAVRPGSTYFDEAGRLNTQPADLVVVSGAAIESARLLLNSKTSLFPKGIGNRYDWVGRNLQGHTYTGASASSRSRTYDDLGPGASIAISDYNHGNPGLRGGAMLCNEFIRLPIQFIGSVHRRRPRWGKAHKDACGQFYRRTIAVQGPTQDMPLWDSRVQVDPNGQVIAWGIPVLRLSGGKHPHTIEIGNAMAFKAEAWLKEAGAVETWLKGAGQGLSGGQHQAGTCRMGHDPKTSRGGPILPHPRHAERVRHRRQCARDERRLQSRADDHGERLPVIRAHREGVQRRRAARMTLLIPVVHRFHGSCRRDLLQLPRDRSYCRSMAQLHSPADRLREVPWRFAAGGQRNARREACARRRARADPAQVRPDRRGGGALPILPSEPVRRLEHRSAWE